MRSACFRNADCPDASPVATPARRDRTQCVNWIRVRGCTGGDSRKHRRLRIDAMAPAPTMPPQPERGAHAPHPA
jgi:hypothetical protein